MQKIGTCAAGLLAALVAVAPTETLAKAIGKPIDGWSFFADIEQGELVCRAIRKNGKRADIIAYRAKTGPFLTVSAEGRNGKWPKSLVRVPGKAPGTLSWEMTAAANGDRLWFAVKPEAVDQIVAAGAYEWSLGDTEDTDKVVIGKRGTEIWGRVNDCIVSNGK